MHRPGIVALAQLADRSRAAFRDRVVAERWAQVPGLRPPAFAVLFLLAEGSASSQKELGDAVGVHASDMVEIIDVLEREGWVVRARDEGDRRRYRLTLTDAGIAVVDRLRTIAGEVEAQVMAPLEPGERQQLVSLVERCAPPGPPPIAGPCEVSPVPRDTSG